MPDKPGGATQIFREDTGAWLVKPMGGFVRALRDVGTAADVQAKVPIGKNGSLGEAAAKMNALFSVAHQGAGAAPCLLCRKDCVGGGVHPRPAVFLLVSCSLPLSTPGQVNAVCDLPRSDV